jgi:predicted molibdopterin-dependent oxidoreductase YjgC
VIVAEGLFDEEYVARKTNDFDVLVNHLGNYSPEETESITGVPALEVVQTARLYAGADRATIIYGSGIAQQAKPRSAIWALTNLTMLTGNAGHGGIYFLARENNARGAADMGSLPDYYPGYRPVTDRYKRSELENSWDCALPGETGLSALEMVSSAAEGTLKSLYIVGENPVLSFPDQELTTKALSTLDFLVVQDIFLTETAELANVVLPAASFAEKDGSVTNFEGLIRPVRRAVESPGTSLADWLIILRLAERMGKAMPFQMLQQVMSEIEGLIPGYEDYTEGKPVSTELGARTSQKKGFRSFSILEFHPRDTEDMDDYPFTLICGTTLTNFGSGTRSSRAPRLKAFSADPYVEINSEDAKNCSLNEGDGVKIISPTGEIETIVKLTGTLPPGTLFLPISFPETPVSHLFDTKLDPDTKTPLMNAVQVKIEKVQENGQEKG